MSGPEAVPSPPSSSEVSKQSRAITLLFLMAFVAYEKGETYLDTVSAAGYSHIRRGICLRTLDNFALLYKMFANGRFNHFGPGSSVGIASDYGLNGPGIESRWSEILRTCPVRPWGPPCLLYNGYRVFLGGRNRPGPDADSSPPSSSEV